MGINLTSEQSELVHHAVETGRIHDAQDAGQQAMALWAEHERKRLAFIKTLDEAEASVARGEAIAIRNKADETAFFDDIKSVAAPPLKQRNLRKPDGLYHHFNLLEV